MSPESADLQKCLRNRSHFLRHLRCPAEKCELARDLCESRSTIDRALRELERAGFVARGDDGYRTTLAGELALTEYDRHAERLDGLAEFREALARLSPDAALDAAVFADADASFPSRHSPHEPVEALASFLADADHARAFASAIIPRYVDIYRERIADGGMTADLVLSEAVVEWLLTHRKSDLSALVECESVSASRTASERPFGLVVTGREESRRVGVMLYDDGTLLGFVSNDSHAALAWADDTFERISAGATPLCRDS
ncbi:helix-turn-helix transcriptional regulator [Halorussus amylolyticus]|uniref:helix-turn-helix transcriptional regulator n=1 Tax=Halorussus amylolyticus TaxID=1126242 RepID=UPI00104976F7|nr:hypothetical protein [Halorussus amylolyticus]